MNVKDFLVQTTLFCVSFDFVVETNYFSYFSSKGKRSFVMMILKRLKLFIFCMLIGLAYSNNAAACTAINSLPFAITTPGQYCLTSDLQSSAANGIQISIGASNVTLNLGGFSLKCVAGQNAIMGSQSVSNVSIENGSVRDCNYAVALSACTSCSVKNINAINNAVGISVGGFAAIVEHNQIRNDNPNSGTSILVNANASLIDGNHISGSITGIVNRGKGNIFRGNSFSMCQTAMRLDVRATYQDNLTQLCSTTFTGTELATSTNAGGNF
jgi:hypothetical protein